MEIKLVLMMTLRRFNITTSYDTWDHDQGGKEPQTMYEERAYQVLKGTSRPVNGFPCRVTAATQ
jgi:hypothetical protein